MNGSKLAFKWLGVCAAGVLLSAGSASAQWSGTVKVSDAIEAPNSQFTGAVSAARCGTDVVVGFGDQESSSSNSFAGFAVSRNNGAGFSDRGVLPVSTDTSGGYAPDALGADLGFPAGSNGEHPAAETSSVACANSSLFYYASVYTSWSNSSFPGACVTGPMCAAITVSISSDGGVTWGLPTLVAMRSGDIHDLVFPAMAVDPSNSQQLYVAYLIVNFAGPFDTGDGNCNFGSVYELRLASSANAGKTWADNVVDFACTDGNQPAEINGEIMAPSIAVGPDGKVYVAYEFIPQGTPGGSNEIRFSRSLDHGQTFSAPLHISTALGNTMPKLAVDRTASKFRGTVYLTWSGMPRGTTTEVLMSDSLDQGASFSFPRPVRATSQGTQINPVVAVDNDGQVATCYYVTGTNTPTSSSNYFYNCLTSFNHAATWTGYQKLATSAPAGYDSLTSDFLLGSDGFFTAFEVPTSGQRHVVGAKSDLN